MGVLLILFDIGLIAMLIRSWSLDSVLDSKTRFISRLMRNVLFTVKSCKCRLINIIFVILSNLFISFMFVLMMMMYLDIESYKWLAIIFVLTQGFDAVHLLYYCTSHKALDKINLWKVNLHKAMLVLTYMFLLISGAFLILKLTGGIRYGF